MMSADVHVCTPGNAAFYVQHTPDDRDIAKWHLPPSEHPLISASRKGTFQNQSSLDSTPSSRIYDAQTTVIAWRNNEGILAGTCQVAEVGCTHQAAIQDVHEAIDGEHCNGERQEAKDGCVHFCVLREYLRDIGGAQRVQQHQHQAQLRAQLQSAVPVSLPNMYPCTCPNNG